MVLLVPGSAFAMHCVVDDFPVLALELVMSCLGGWVYYGCCGFVCSELRVDNMLGLSSWKLCCGWAGLWSCMFCDVLHMCWPRVGPTVVWMDGLTQCFGFVGSELRVNKLLGFALVNLVVVGLGCGHEWFCVCLFYVALGWFKSCLDGWVDSLFGVLLGQSCR